MQHGSTKTIARDVSSPAILARLSVCAAAGLLVYGCAVGPDFKKPAAPAVGNYTAHPLARTAVADTPGGEAQTFENGKDIAANWWTLFHSKPLNRMIARVLANNHDLKAARAALKAAHEDVLAQRGVFFPAIGAGFSAVRQKQPETLAPVPNYPLVPHEFQYNLFTPQVSVSYVPDVFGLNRRTLESAQAQKQAVRYQMAATYNTLIANAVVAAIQEASIAAQIDATHQLIDTQTDALKILQYQYDKGYASGPDLAAQKAQRAQAVAALPPLLKQQAQLRDMMAVLAGQFPAQASADTFALSSLNLPRQIPVSLPSHLVTQRPDVLQAQANLHAASAQIGIAIANRLPQIALSANDGSSALTMDTLFSAGTGFWNLGADLAAPIFQGGALLHQERAARAAYQQAAEQYRGTVLMAFQNVADTLTALEQDAEALKAAAAAQQAAKTSLDLSRRQLQDGYVGDLGLLNTQQAYQQARIGLIEARADRLSDTAALFQALGGGWWHRTDMGGDKHDG